MAVHNKPVPKPPQRAVNRDVAQRPAGRPAAKPAPAQRSLIQGARDRFSGKTVVKQELAAIIKPGTGNTQSLISHDKAVNFLEHFLAKNRKA